MLKVIDNVMIILWASLLSPLLTGASIEICILAFDTFCLFCGFWR